MHVHMNDTTETTSNFSFYYLLLLLCTLLSSPFYYHNMTLQNKPNGPADCGLLMTAEWGGSFLKPQDSEMTRTVRMPPRHPSEHVGMPLSSIPYRPSGDWSQVATGLSN
jgi:hypothetical protein